MDITVETRTQEAREALEWHMHLYGIPETWVSPLYGPDKKNRGVIIALPDDHTKEEGQSYNLFEMYLEGNWMPSRERLCPLCKAEVEKTGEGHAWCVCTHVDKPIHSKF